MNPIGQIRVNRRVLKTSMTATKDIKNGLQNTTKILSIDAAPLKKGALTQGNASHTPLVVHHSDILSCSGLFYHICGTSIWVSLLATSFCFLFVFLFICCCSLFFLLPVSFLSSPFSLFVFFLLLSCFLSSLPSLFSFFLFFCTFFTLVFLRLFLIKSITYAVQHQLAF